MKAKVFLIIFMIGMGSLLSQIQINPASGPYYVGDNISFRTPDYCYSYYSFDFISWGDSSPNFTNPTVDTWYSHQFLNPGNYQVRFYDTYGYCGTDERTWITIEEKRRIEMDPPRAVSGQLITFRAINFLTPKNIRWDMGDGTILSLQNKRGIMGGYVITHTYANPGTYVIRAYDYNGNTAYLPVTLSVNVSGAARSITNTPDIPRADQSTRFDAVGFVTAAVDWNFGDGTILPVAAISVIHRFRNEGIYTVSAKDSSIPHTPVTKAVTVLPDIRRIELSAPEIKVNQEVLITAFNFYGDFILWNFGDGTAPETGLHEIRHTYRRSGRFTITALDENGQSQSPKQALIRVLGINDEINIELAEIRFDNGKYYKIIPKLAKDFRAILRLKVRGTGLVSGFWLVDNRPFEYFNEVAVIGEIKEIYTKPVPGLPVFEPGLHTLSVQLTRPADVGEFPILRYYVLPYENVLETIAPADGFVAKEDEIPTFSWKEPRLAAKYQISFANDLYPFLFNTSEVVWIDVKGALLYTPPVEVWNKIERNRWTYWKVRGFDNSGNVVTESDVQDLKVVIATAMIELEKITDLKGQEISLVNNEIISGLDHILIHGNIEYLGDSEFLVLRVYAANELVDQLLFRDVKKGEKRSFETSIPNKGGKTNILFQVLKTSSPAVIIGIKGISLKKTD